MTNEKELICYYSGEKATIAELKVKLKEFHEIDGVKGNGEQYSFFSDGEFYCIGVNTWDGNGYWKPIVTL